MSFKFETLQIYENPCPDCTCKECCDTGTIVDMDGYEWDCFCGKTAVKIEGSEK